MKAIEDSRGLVLRNTGAVIFDNENERTVRSPGQLHRGDAVSVRVRVVDEIVEDSFHPPLVECHHVGHVAADLENPF
jgi:hypothetical protein